ncbi:hypothetical protein SLEP1_g42607 [Rubroshorea leprosula]|uniref:Laccase n=1 Tax=Rubroshorea leprosula TaxID=152421 RepID=A0AAV5LAE9_9ROSI|nr:hypothetical protein SLEP1_g42607 [Rubroshorea leprosula]
MAFLRCLHWLIACVTLLAAFVQRTRGTDIYLEWNVAYNNSIRRLLLINLYVIAINGEFPGPLINATTNDLIHINDGVAGTNCPIHPNTNWTYVFQTKDQIGTFFYFPSINFQKAAGGYGPIRVNNRNVIAVSFPKPEDEFDFLIGDWFSGDYKEISSKMDDISSSAILMNGKGPYGDPRSTDHESFTVTKGKTCRFRISNEGSSYNFIFRIQNHKMVVVETEGSYTNQTTLGSLHVHVGQSYSVLVTADQIEADNYIVVTPKWNLTTGAARPDPQGTFTVSNVTISQTFVLQGLKAEINGTTHYTVNNISYDPINTPLKLAGYFVNGSCVYQLDWFPVDSVHAEAAYGVSVVTGIHKGWIGLVFRNNLDVMDSWNLDGFGFYVVGFGNGDWTPESRSTYNLYDPVVRSTHPGTLKNWYLGQELYIRVHDPDPNPAKGRPPPENLLLCGIFEEYHHPTAAPASAPESGL